jgi:threonine/homoserine/homoserine lactone efflux protein
VANLFALAAATAMLVMIPGPNVALIVATSLRFGVQSGVAAVLGTTAGVALQLLLVIGGLAVIIELAAQAMTWIRWAGVAYLIYLGISTWRQPAPGLSGVVAAPAVFWRGCLVAAVNPKTLLFNAAFLPQFVTAGGGAGSLAAVAAVYLIVVFAGDMIWATAAGAAARLFDRLGDARHRVSGAFLVAAGLGLAFSRRNL